jgi:hypothetical protein
LIKKKEESIVMNNEIQFKNTSPFKEGDLLIEVTACAVLTVLSNLLK